MSSSDIEIIERELQGKLEGVDVEWVVNKQLQKLNSDYQDTVNAEWEADFEGEYQVCPSEDSEEELEINEQYEEEKPTEIRDIQLSSEKIEKIKEIMRKLSLKPPSWASFIPEEKWDEFVQIKANSLIAARSLS